MASLEKLFADHLKSNADYQLATAIVRSNSQDGQIWLIGGFVFRSLAHLLHGTPPPATDLDFIVEQPSPKLILPPGWSCRANSFGNPKLIGPDLEIDFVPLTNIYSIKERGLEPTIEKFLSGAPLDIQAVAYEITSGRLLGDSGLKAITNRTASINNPEAARLYEQHYGRPIADLIAEKAASLRPPS